MADRQELGALWRKTSQRTGNQFYSGDLTLPGGEKIKVIAFDNDRKTKENQPDIRIYLSEDSNSGGGSQRSNNYSKPAPAPRREQAPARVETPIEYPTEDIDPDDIPF